LTLHYDVKRLCFSPRTKSASAAVRASKSVNQHLEDYQLGLRLWKMDIPAIQVVRASDEVNDATLRLSEACADAHMIALKAVDLVVMHNNNEALTEPQMTELCALIQRQVERHQKPDSVESKLIDEDDKNLYFISGKIKGRHPVNNTFAWPSKVAAKVCGCSKTDVKPIMTRLEKLGAITRIQKGAARQHSKRASIDRREV